LNIDGKYGKIGKIFNNSFLGSAQEGDSDGKG
jgi:hypothetical protein